MKNLLLYLALILVLGYACKKENPKNDLPKKGIFYKDISPDYEMNTIDSFTFQDRAVCTTYVPVPLDSTVSFDLDVNNDQVKDFKITVHHEPFTRVFCGQCDKFTYSFFIEGLRDGAQIAVNSMQVGAAKLFEVGNKVSNSSAFINRAEIFLEDGCLTQLNPTFSEAYIGIKLNNSFGYINLKKLDFNGLMVLDHGFNYEEDTEIACGEK